MSHFTVLVIGDDIEGQLSPFDENMRVEGTRVDYTESDFDQAREWHVRSYDGYDQWILAGKPDPDPKDGDYYKFRNFREIDSGVVPPLGADIRDIMNWYHGNNIECEDTDDDNFEMYYYDTYNPDSKWDWYQIGGRWAGFFKLKDGVEPTVPIDFSWGWSEEDKAEKLKGNYCDQARKGDIDFEGMRREESERCANAWDEYHKLVEGTAPLVSFESYKDKHPDDIQKARDEYHAQERLVQLREKDTERRFFWNPQNFEVPREEYILKAERSAISTFAFLKDGEWVEKGEMGWFGMASNEMDQGAWDEQFYKMINDLPDDTLLTVVDCHI